VTERQLGHVLFRVLGLWMIAGGVAQSGTLLSEWIHLPNPPTGVEQSAVIAPMAVYVATGLVVWGWADRLAALVFSDARTPIEPPPLDVASVYRAVVSAFGLFLLVTAVPNAVSWAAVWFQASGDATKLEPSDRDMLYGIAAKAQLATIVAQCLLGAFLYLGPHRVLSWARDAFSSHISKGDVER
jgi:hypothetical protein